MYMSDLCHLYDRVLVSIDTLESFVKPRCSLLLREIRTRVDAWLETVNHPSKNFPFSHLMQFGVFTSPCGELCDLLLCFWQKVDALPLQGPPHHLLLLLPLQHPPQRGDHPPPPLLFPLEEEEVVEVKGLLHLRNPIPPQTHGCLRQNLWLPQSPLWHWKYFRFLLSKSNFQSILTK